MRYAVKMCYPAFPEWSRVSTHKFKFMARAAIYFGLIEGFDYRVVALDGERDE